MQFLKVSHRIFNLQLSPTELKIYLFLTKCQNSLATATVRIGTLCDQCAIASATTVRAALDRLEQRGLISRKHRHGRGGRCISSQFTVRQLGGKWFRLWLGVRPFEMDKSAFAVYLYLCQQRVGYSGKAWPSQNMIAASVGLARRTVHEAIKRLVGLGAIIKGAFWIGRHNLYTVIQVCEFAKKGTPLKPFVGTNEGDSQCFSGIFNLIWILSLVKSFFLRVGCAIFGGQYLDVTSNPKKKKKYGNNLCLTVSRYREKCAHFYPQRRFPFLE